MMYHLPAFRRARCLRSALAGTAVLVGLAACKTVSSPALPSPEYYRSNIPHAPFSAAVRVGEVLYVSGQIGISTDGTLAPAFNDQVRQTMSNIGAVLQQAGLGFDDVFKCTVMLADMSRWEDFNKIYVTYFKADRLPARSAIGASGLARGALLEVECLARVRPPI
jgi:2-iminobutanoate/2-iminopropanoate deaminase